MAAPTRPQDSGENQMAWDTRVCPVTGLGTMLTAEKVPPITLPHVVDVWGVLIWLLQRPDNLPQPGSSTGKEGAGSEHFPTRYLMQPQGQQPQSSPAHHRRCWTR